MRPKDLSKINNLINPPCFCDATKMHKVNKISIITGKGSRSKNKEDPYKSKNLSILKYSIPEYINNNVELMEKIKDINYEEVNDISKGSFEIILKN